MHKKDPLRVTMLLILGGTPLLLSAEHINPLDAMSVPHHPQANTPSASPVAPTPRHYSPLDAMNGRMIVKHPTRASSQVTPTTSSKQHSVQKNFVTTQKQKHRPAAAPAQNRQSIVVPTLHPAHPVAVASAHPSPLEVMETNPKRYRHQTEPKIIVTEVPPSPKRVILRAARPQVTVSNVDSSKVGSESPMAHAASIPLVAVPAYKTTPIPGKAGNKVKKASAYAHTFGKKILYMTFDDGPLKGTANLLSVIRGEDVKATMFYIGRNVTRSPKLFHRALSMPNILVANHTYTHANNHYQRFYTGTVQSVVHDIDKAQNTIGGAKYLRLCGRDVWRLPHVHRNDWALSVAERGREVNKYDALANRGYFIYGWDIEWLFSYKTQRPLFSGVEMARRVNLKYRSGRTVKKGKIILLAHDFMWRSATNVRQLRTFIRIMKAQGWTFETIDTYSDVTPAVYVQKRKTTLPATAEKSRKPATISLKFGDHKAGTLSSAPIGKIAFVTPANLTTQLNDAIRKQHFLDVRRLLAQGANINRKDAAGNIPLNLAIKTNNAVMVRMLIERGANIFNTDGHGMSPMGIAREYHNTIIIQYLIRQIAEQRQHKLHKTPFSLEA